MSVSYKTHISAYPVASITITHREETQSGDRRTASATILKQAGDFEYGLSMMHSWHFDVATLNISEFSTSSSGENSGTGPLGGVTGVEKRPG